MALKKGGRGISPTHGFQHAKVVTTPSHSSRPLLTHGHMFVKQTFKLIGAPPHTRYMPPNYVRHHMCVLLKRWL